MGEEAINGDLSVRAVVDTTWSGRRAERVGLAA
jgi:hypothetical protein